MKIKKNAKQKNFIVDKDFYAEYDLLSMSQKKIIFCLDEFYNIRFITNIRQVENSCFRIFADDCKEVKVVYNYSFGCYQTVVVTNNNQIIYVSL